MFRRRENSSEARIGIVAIGAALCLLAGIGLIAGASLFVERAAVAPVPINELGLSEEQGENLRQYLQSFPGTTILNGDTDEENRKKSFSFDPLVFKAAGGKWPFHGPQMTGDCSGFASAGTLEDWLAGAVESGDADHWRPVLRQATYSQGRFDENGKRVISGAGSDPSLQVESFQRDGVLFADYDDVPAYSKASAVEYGNKGIPAKFKERMTEFKVRDVQRCKTAQGVCNQIVDGKNPVFFGSFKFGTTKIKLLPNGMNVALDNTAWPHAQKVSGYKYDAATDQGYFRVMNSWGASAHMPLSTIPGDRPGGYYISWDTMQMICGEGMTFAISGIDGFEKREFPPDFHIFGAAPGEDRIMENAAINVTQGSWSVSQDASAGMAMVGWLLVLAAVGIIAARALGNRGSSLRFGPFKAVLMLLALTGTTPAQDAASPPNAGGPAASNVSPAGDTVVDFGSLLVMAQHQNELIPQQALQATAATREDYHEDLFTLVRQHIEDQQLESPGVQKLLDATAPPLGGYSQCCCQGNKQALCFCLKNGKPCSCTASTGSLWHDDNRDGNPDRKVAAGEPLAIKPRVVAKDAPVSAAQPTASPKGKWVRFRVCDGRGRCWFENRWVAE